MKEAEQLAKALTANREKQATPFEKHTNKLLAQVGMPNARIKVAISKEALNITAVMKLNFYLTLTKATGLNH